MYVPHIYICAFVVVIFITRAPLDTSFDAEWATLATETLSTVTTVHIMPQ